MLRKYAFIVSILGIAVLLGLLILSPRELGSLEELDNIEINEKVVLEGKVESERDFGDFKVLSIRGIEIVCECGGEDDGSYLNKEVKIIGLVEEFRDKRQVRVLRIVESI